MKIKNTNKQGKLSMQRFIFVGSLLMIAITAGVISVNQNKKKLEETNLMLAKYGLQEMSTKEIVSHLDRVVDEPATLMAGLTGKNLTLFDADKEYVMPLSEDSFYLSFAPYLNTTHPCSNHNLITCRSELRNQEFDVTITNKDGTVVVSDTLTSMDNGFIGVWLPRDIEATIQIDFGKVSASADISTYKDSNTCLTTPLRLS